MAAPLAIGSLVLGGIQAIGGLVSAFSMGDRPRFREGPRFTGAAGRAEYMAGMGYTPQERAAFQGDIAAQTAGDYRRGIDMAGGNMSRALGGISTARTLGAYNRFAAQDAALRRQNIQYADQFSRERQRRADMQTQADMAQYDREQQATGQAISSGLTQMGGALNFNQAMKFYKDLYGGSGDASGAAGVAGVAAGGATGGGFSSPSKFTNLYATGNLGFMAPKPPVTFGGIPYLMPG